MKIVFLSHTPRNSIFKVGSVHLSNAMQQMGHQVLYVSSAISPFHILNVSAFKDEDYRQTFKSRAASFKVQKDADGILNLTPFIFTPFHKGIFDDVNIPLQKKFTFNGVAKQLKKIGFDKTDLVIQDRPGLFFMRKCITAKKWIYRTTDDYSNMPGGASTASMQELEQHICKFADQVVVTSKPLREKFMERYNVEPAVIRNGVDATHFNEKRAVPTEYKNINGPIILYVGSLDDRFDLELLLNTARKSSSYQFVIVGPGSQKMIPKNAHNIKALGSRPYEQIPAYMQHADVGILPLKLTPANHARSPMKIYEYGICGLPVVSTPLHELQIRKEDFITFAETDQQFSAAVRSCLDQHEKLSDTARQQSRLHGWGSIAEQIITL